MGRLKNLGLSFMKNFIYIILLSLALTGCSNEKKIEGPAETTTSIYELDEDGNRKIDKEDKDEKDEDN